MNICVNLNSRSQNKAQIWLYHRLFQIFRLGGCRWLHWRQNSDCPNHSRGTWQIIGDISTRSTLRGAASHRFQHQGLSTLDQETWEDVVVNKQVETNGCCCKQESGQKWTWHYGFNCGGEFENKRNFIVSLGVVLYIIIIFGSVKLLIKYNEGGQSHDA